jgi:hypothetical protein
MDLTSGGGPEAAETRKCRKVNPHLQCIVTGECIARTFALFTTSLLFGGKTSAGGGMIVKMVMDEGQRVPLYTQ